MHLPIGANRRLAAVVALVATSALGASCFLPLATAGAGTGGEGGGGHSPVDGLMLPADDQPIVVPTGGPPVHAPSGTAMQHHLVFAGRQWWLFYLTAEGILVQSSLDFYTWTPPPSVITPSTGISLLVQEPVDGRIFGVDTRPLDADDSILHIGMTGVEEGPGTDRQHARALVQGDTLSFDPLPGPTGVKAPPDLPDGTVTVVGTSSPHRVVDFASVGTGGASCGACAQTAVSPDDGGAWANDFSAPMSLDVDGGSSDVTLRGAMAIDGYLVTVWRDGTALRFVTLPDVAWQQSAQGTLLDVTDAGALDARTFASCAQPSVLQGPPARAHVLSWAPGGFLHHSTTDGQGWSRWEPPALPFDGDLGELFLACGSDAVYAFTIDASDQRILVTRWDQANGWSPWTTAVPPVTTTPYASPQRCFLAGYDRVTPVGIGLLWTQTNDCTQASGSFELHGAFVGRTSG